MVNEKLKTLKDIEDARFNPLFKFIYVNDLRQEAIKWIKDLDDVSKTMNDIGQFREYDEDNLVTRHPCNLINWIKHFFNITKEELK